MSSTVSASGVSRQARSALGSLRDPSVRGIVFPVAGIVVMLAFFSVKSPRFFTVLNFSDILRDGAVLLIVAIGATWVIQMGSIDLSNGAIVVLAGLVSSTLVENRPVWLAVLVALGCSLIAGIVNGFLLAYARLPSFLVTLGTSLVITGIGLVYVGGRTIPILDPSFTELSQGQLVGSLPNLVLWSLILFAVAVFVGFKTKFGRYVAVIGGGEVVARLSGVPVRRYKFYAFIIAAGLAGLGGILMAARLGSGSPNVGSEIVLLSIAAVVMSGTPLTGGLGGVHRTIIGVLVISILQNGLSGMEVGPFAQLIIQGCVVVLAVASTIDRSRELVAK